MVGKSTTGLRPGEGFRECGKKNAKGGAPVHGWAAIGYSAGSTKPEAEGYRQVNLTVPFIAPTPRPCKTIGAGLRIHSNQ
jgi:hypothetical protein